MYGYVIGFRKGKIAVWKLAESPSNNGSRPMLPSRMNLTTLA
jgi:hypothetical protein